MATKTDEVSTYDSASMYVRVSDLSRSTIFWNCSSIGRALPCHGKGRGIETLQFRLCEHSLMVKHIVANDKSRFRLPLFAPFLK